jgi:dipeptidyl aminopeptidase/acylaminoacyl peptidase
MPLAAGARLGPYQILAPMSSGGMGEVYRARDLRLGRDVAIKVPPAAVAQDPERLRRFEQEARSAGQLNHPNILAIHDVGEHEGVHYLVSELLEGATLRERLAAEPMPARKAVDYAQQVARGLAAAHDRRIVHRDLKPENLFVTRDGLVKILDFGLAKQAAAPPDTPPAGAGAAQATTVELTEPGVVLGTVGYMSPEQVRGEAADARSDIFSFGAVLYEMLAGRRAFQGGSAVETMHAILRDEPPDVAAGAREIPPGLDRVVRHCLEKRPAERFQSARDLAFALETLSTPTSPGVPAVRPAPRRGAWRALAGVAAFAAVAGVAYVAGRGGEAPAEARYRQVTFRRGTVQAARFAPGGDTVLYSARFEGEPGAVYSARLDTGESRSLSAADTALLAVTREEMAVLLQRAVGAGGSVVGTLARVPLLGGAPREVQEDVLEADLTPDGKEFAVVRLAEGGCQLEFPIGRVLARTAGYLDSARISPGGDRVAFVDHPMATDTRGAVAVVDRGGVRTVLSDGWVDVGGLAWSADGREVWFTASREGSSRGLQAVTLQGRARTLARMPGQLVLQDVHPDGRLLLTHAHPRLEVRGRAAGEAGERDFSWLDMTVVKDISPDGRMMLFDESGEGGGPGYAVYLRKTDRSLPVRLGEGSAQGLSPDGRFALSIRLARPPELVLLPTGAGQARALPRGAVREYHWACFLPDGKRVLLVGNEEGRATRLFVQDVDGGGPRPVTPEGTWMESNTVTPDGRFAVARGEESRLFPLDGAGEGRPVPGLEAGDAPLRWSADGGYLFLRARGAGLPARVVRLDAGSGRREPWMELSPADPAGVVGVGSIVLTPDGRTYVYEYVRSLSDLYLVEGMR